MLSLCTGQISPPAVYLLNITETVAYLETQDTDVDESVSDYFYVLVQIKDYYETEYFNWTYTSLRNYSGQINITGLRPDMIYVVKFSWQRMQYGIVDDLGNVTLEILTSSKFPCEHFHKVFISIMQNEMIE